MSRKTSAFVRTLAAPLLGAAIAMLPAAAGAVSIIVTNTNDGDNGFNDDTPVAPVGRNPGTTIGEQRMYVFQYAADAWGLRLRGNVPVIVSASFDDLGGTPTGAILGQAAATTVHRDFPGVAKPETWFVAALANQFRGRDLNDAVPTDCPNQLLGDQCPEIAASFNSEVDGNEVLGARGFYYGVDGNSGQDIDFLSVVLHEIGHGLGVLDLIEPTFGTMYFGFKDAFIDHLIDENINPKQVARMSNVQRQKAVVDDGFLVWTGQNVKTFADGLEHGQRDGAVQIFAPEIYQPGSSISHFDTRVFPNELMEPYLTGTLHDLRMTTAMLHDIGWELAAFPTCGDANNDQNINATDALQTLRGAVGSSSCAAEVCDVISPGGVTSSDALPLLRYSVGQTVALSCP